MSFCDILMGNPTMLPAAPFRQPLLRNEILSSRLALLQNCNEQWIVGFCQMAATGLEMRMASLVR